VKIPFKARFKEPLLDGTKTWTSRTRRLGNVGDTFDAFGHEFEILKVEHRMLKNVAFHWREEGCSSREDFVEVWKQIHPRKGYDPQQIVKVHVFRRITI